MYLFCVRDNWRVRRVRVRVELAYEGQGRRGKSRTGSFLSSAILERRRRRRADYGDAEGMRGYREMTFPIVLVIHWRNFDRITKTIGRMLLRGLPLIVFLLVQLRHRVIWWAPSFEFSPLIWKIAVNKDAFPTHCKVHRGMNTQKVWFQFPICKCIQIHPRDKENLYVIYKLFPNEIIRINKEKKRHILYNKNILL